MSKFADTGPAAGKEIVSVRANRKSCSADGVGLSHYILMDKVSGTKTPAADAALFASRKSCNADGVGLSHYILMDRDAG